MRHKYPKVEQRLREAGIRPTRPRLALLSLLESYGHHHLSAESLHKDAQASRINVSLATVYNTLHQFTEAGFVRQVVVENGKSYFDTNPSHHHHFFNEDTGELHDIDESRLPLHALPDLPQGTRLASVDVIIRIRGDHGG